MLNDKFDNIYCINLDRRTDRWKESMRLFRASNVSVERVSGIEDPVPWQGLRKSIIGVFKNAIEAGYSRILILEDDVEWDESFNERFLQCWDALPDAWDMFYFSAAHQIWPKKENDLLFKLSWSTAAHAIGFDRKCFGTVLEHLEKNEAAIDVTYSILQPKLNAYACIEPIAWQRRSYSDIEGEEKWYPYLKDVGFYDRYHAGLVNIEDEEVRPPSEGNQ